MWIKTSLWSGPLNSHCNPAVCNIMQHMRWCCGEVHVYIYTYDQLSSVLVLNSLRYSSKTSDDKTYNVTFIHATNKKRRDNKPVAGKVWQTQKHWTITRLYLSQILWRQDWWWPIFSKRSHFQPPAQLVSSTNPSVGTSNSSCHIPSLQFTTISSPSSSTHWPDGIVFSHCSRLWSPASNR